MFFLLVVLTDDCMNHSLQNIFFRYYAFHIFDQIISICGLVVLEVVNNQVESSFWNHIDEWRENLERILSSSENDKVVSQQIIVLEDISYS